MSTFPEPSIEYEVLRDSLLHLLDGHPLDEVLPYPRSDTWQRDANGRWYLPGDERVADAVVKTAGMSRERYDHLPFDERIVHLRAAVDHYDALLHEPEEAWAKQAIEILTRERPGPARLEPDRVPVNSTALPKEWLRSWRDICSALREDHKDYRKLKDLNARFDGPIQSGGKGGQPFVDKAQLLDWWDRLSVLQAQRANQRTGKTLSVEGVYKYGRDGAVAPEIGGSVKRRRSDRRT